MALNVAVRTFDWLTSQTAGTTIDVDFGFTPKALIVFNTSGLTADGVSTSVVKGASRIGFAGGTLSANRRVICYDSTDGAASAAILSRSEDDGIMCFAGSTGLLDIDAEANWPANSIRFIVDLQHSGGENQHCTAIAFGGTDIVASTTGTITEPGATGDQVVTTTGVNPSVVFLASCGTTTADSGVQGVGAWMLGAGDGTRSWVHAMGSDDAALTMDTVAYMKSSQIVALMPTADAITIDAEATLASLGTGEFTLNWSSQTASGRQVFYLAIEVATSLVRVDNLLTATDTNQFTDTGYGLTPSLAFFVSANRAESTATTPTAGAQLSWGAAESATTREAQGWIDEDGTANTEITVALETDEVYINLDTAGAVQGLMDVVSFDSGGMTLVMDDADPAQSFVGVFVIGASAAGVTATGWGQLLGGRRNYPVLLH